MLTRELKTDWNHIKTFATEKNLRKSLEFYANSYPEHDDRFIVMRTPEGRWTAIVSLDMTKGGYVCRYPFLKI